MVTFMKHAMQKVGPVAVSIGTTVAMTHSSYQKEQQNKEIKKVPGHTCCTVKFFSSAGITIETEYCKAPKKAVPSNGMK